jgi:hypothetical protein
MRSICMIVSAQKWCRSIQRVFELRLYNLKRDTPVRRGCKNDGETCLADSR